MRRSPARSYFCALLIAAVSLVVMGLFGFTPPIRATGPIVVNSLADSSGACASRGTGTCTLRDAITFANANPGADTINFGVSGSIILSPTLPAIDDDVTIDGSGRAITVSGSSRYRVLTINTGTNVTLNALTIANGADASGGGIANFGTLTVTNSTFSDNNGGLGGGISNGKGVLTVSSSTFSDNAADEGGGISNEGTLTVTNSTFSGNFANGGGGIDNGGKLTVTNSTFSANGAFYVGGGISNEGTLTVTNSTISGNVAFSADGIYNDGTTTLQNTLIANSMSGDNCDSAGGTLTANTYNLADDSTCSSATVVPTTQIALQPLANNGGATRTMALGAGSVAIDAGDDAVCPPADQRGVVRPIGPHCDVGAYEAFNHFAYLPFVASNFVEAPDLIVSNLIASTNAVTVVIQNNGHAPVADEFWVDLYVNPNPAPTAVNQVWNDGRASQGVVWGVTSSAFLSLLPGGSLTLTLSSPYYRADLSHLTGLPTGTPVYAQVDSADALTTYGAVLETHEITGGAYNNLGGPALSTLSLASGPSRQTQGPLATPSDPLPPRPLADSGRGEAH